MNSKIGRLFKIIKITYSSKYAMKVANEHWQKTDITHGSMSEKQFDFYYNELTKLILPNKDSKILDYGGGNGEIAYRFKKEGYKISHCDLSKKMVNNAKEKFKLDSCECKDIDGKYDIIIFHNAFFYVHPKLQKEVLIDLYKKLSKNGRLYITDTPDFNKRYNLKNGKFMNFITYFFPVYQIELAGFFINHNVLKNFAEEIGFNIEKKDSWANYRSHWILSKGS